MSLIFLLLVNSTERKTRWPPKEILSFLYSILSHIKFIKINVMDACPTLAMSLFF